MLTFEPEGEIDLENYQVADDWTMKDAEKFIIRLARYGYRGEEYRSLKILNAGREKFPENGHLKFPGRSKIDNLIADAPFAPTEPPYKTEKVPRNWRSYVARLSMISEFWHQKDLTAKEAMVAEYVGSEFQDPFGEEVDLIPQLAVVRQIASAEATKANHVLESFDNYFMYAPWKLGTEFLIKHGRDFPVVSDFMMFVSPSENWRDISPVFEDALRQLGMPYTAFYWMFEDAVPVNESINQFPSLPHYGEEAKGKCNWQTILDSRTPEDQAELMQPLEIDEYTQRLIDLAECSFAIGGRPHSSSYWSLRPWLKKDKWIQIERVPYKEETND